MTKSEVIRDGAMAALALIKETSEAMPPLKAAAGAAVWIAETVEAFHSNKEDWISFGVYVTVRIADVANTIGNRRSTLLEKDLEVLLSVLEEIEEDIQTRKDRSTLSKVLQAREDPKLIASLREKVKDALERFSLRSHMAVREVLGDDEKPLPPTLTFTSFVPPKPSVFFGRDGLVTKIVNTVAKSAEAQVGAHVAVLGLGGMGKTSLALAVLHRSEVKATFGSHIHFVSCEPNNSALMLVLAIGASMKLSLPSKDPLGRLITILESETDPIILALDNFETCWENDWTDVQQVLQYLGAISRLTLIITMRGLEHPSGLSWDISDHLDVLTPDAAKKAFLANAPNATDDLQLDNLLSKVDYMPLAVSLLAAVAQTGEPIATLHQRLALENTGVMVIDSSHRNRNLKISIKISLESKPIRENPNALRLLSTICLLPDGLSNANLPKVTALPSRDVFRAASVLRRVALIQDDVRGNLKVLSPIRTYISTHDPPPPRDDAVLYQHYFTLAALGGAEMGSQDFVNAHSALSTELGNMQSVLSRLLEGTRSIPLEQVGLTVLRFSCYLYHVRPSIALLQRLLELHKNNLPDSLHAQCLLQLGRIQRSQGAHVQAIASLQKAKRMFEEHDDRHRAAQCLRSIGSTYFMQSNYEFAKSYLDKARDAFLTLNVPLEVAKCIHSLANLLYMEGNYKEARQALMDARRRLLEVGGQHGAARGLRRLGDILRMEDKFDEAEENLEGALLDFQELQYLLGQAQCLRSLGEIHRARTPANLVLARNRLEKARSIFQSLQFPVGVTQCQHSLGDILYMEGQDEEAKAVLQEAQKEYVKVGYKIGATQCLQSLGNIFYMQGNYAEGLRLYTRAKEEYILLKQRSGVVECTRYIGNILYWTGKAGEACPLLEEALKGFRELGDQRGIAECLQSLGNAYSVAGDHEKAIKSLEQSVDGFKALGVQDWHQVAQTVNYLAIAHQDAEDFDQAGRLLKESRAIFEAHGNLDGVAMCDSDFEGMHRPVSHGVIRKL